MGARSSAAVMFPVLDVSQPVLDRLETESQRLNEMISRLLTLSKLESGSQDFERSAIDLLLVRVLHVRLSIS